MPKIVIKFEHSNFDIVSDFAFRASDFHYDCFVSVKYLVAHPSKQIFKP